MSARHTLSIPPDVSSVLRESRIESDRVFLPNRQLDRKLYAGVVKVLAEYGGKWNRSAGAVLIKAEGRAKLLEALDSGVVQREKVIRQAFYTPDDVADQLCRFASERLPVSTEDLRLLEPSAGGGALIRAAHRLLHVSDVTAVEIDKSEAEALRLSVQTLVAGDFLAQTAGGLGLYDLILMNPPFQKGQALKHVAHALRFLRSGGVLAAIVPLNFPDEVDGVELESEELEAGAFKESGTSIATKMIRCVGQVSP